MEYHNKKQIAAIKIKNIVKHLESNKDITILFSGVLIDLQEELGLGEKCVRSLFEPYILSKRIEIKNNEVFAI